MTLLRLLKALGRTDDVVGICTKVPGENGLQTHWVVFGDADAKAAEFSGTHDVWFNVQPMTPPVHTYSRGTSKDVTAIQSIYVDVDFRRDAKPGGFDKDQALDFIDDLSRIVGSSPVAIVASGNGLQPYWPLEQSLDVWAGTELLLKWRALVLQEAVKYGVVPDSGVYEAARIMRVPGPLNMKDTDKGAKPTKTGVIFKDGMCLDVPMLLQSLDLVLIEKPTFRSGDSSSRSRDASQGDGERIFTDEQAMEFIQEFALQPLRDVQWGSGQDAWKVTWECSMAAARFSEMFEEDDLKELLRQAIFDGHGVHADSGDEYQIAMGFMKFNESYARRPGDEDFSNPFSRYCNLPPSRLGNSGKPSKIQAEDEVAPPLVYEDAKPDAAPVVDLQVYGTRFRVRRASDLSPRNARWLWRHDKERWIPLGSLVLLGGPPGVGKSTWTARFIAQVTNGNMEGHWSGQPKGVAVAATEDAWEEVIIPRLMAAGVNLDLVYPVDVVEDGATAGLTLPRDVENLKQLIADRDIAMVVLDPLLSTVASGLDTHKDSDVRRALQPISLLAHESQATFLGLIHQNKSAGTDLTKSLMGSTAFLAVSRAALICVKGTMTVSQNGEYDPLVGANDDQIDGLFLSQIKNNLGPVVASSIHYKIDEVHVLHGCGPFAEEFETSKIHVLDYDHPESAEEVVATKARAAAASQDGRRKPEGTAPDRCRAWIKATLEINGSMASSALKDAAEKAGFNASAYKRAAKLMELRNIGTYHDPIMELPDSWSPSAQADD